MTICGKPTSKGTPCQNTGQWCGAHPDPPMDQFLRIIDMATKGQTGYAVDNLGVEWRLFRIVEQITRPAQEILSKRLLEIAMDAARTGRPKEEYQEEMDKIRAARDALTSWARDR